MYEKQDTGYDLIITHQLFCGPEEKWFILKFTLAFKSSFLFSHVRFAVDSDSRIHKLIQTICNGSFTLSRLTNPLKSTDIHDRFTILSLSLYIYFFAIRYFFFLHKMKRKKRTHSTWAKCINHKSTLNDRLIDFYWTTFLTEWLSHFNIIVFICFFFHWYRLWKLNIIISDSLL